MRSRTFLYIPLLILFALSLTVFIQHSAGVLPALSRLINQSESIRVPFEVSKGRVVNLLPEGSAAGMQIGDHVIAISGRFWTEDSVLTGELNKLTVGDPVIYTVRSKGENGVPVFMDIAVESRPISMTLGQTAADLGVTFVFFLLLPALSFALGFYVCLMRPRDPLAWLLLFLLLGIGSVALEGGPDESSVTIFQEIMKNSIGISMLLFGVYFPERLEFDRRHPWAKWILLLPLSIFCLLNIIEQLGLFFGLPALWAPINSITEPLESVTTLMTMTATGTFFASLAVKSATLENKDSRRRLRILYVGTSIGLLPALCIVVYGVISGRNGGFFDLAPWWFAMFALVAILLFPLTMAYVIVVERAMDVRGVIRQGLQYALATKGVVAMQIVLSFLVILIALSFASDTSINRPQKMTFMAVGVTFVFLIRLMAGKIKTWTDRRFFREAYDAEQILSDLSEDVRTMVETRPLLETVSARISESLHVPQIALLLTNGHGFRPAYAIGYEADPAVNLAEDAVTIEKLKKNQPLVIYQDDKDSWLTNEADAVERNDLRELNTQLLLPIGAKNKLSGVISLGPKRSEEPYSPNDLRLLKSVAAQTGIALENSRLTEAVAIEAAQKERLNAELDIAREVQERLFPQELPVIDGLDYFGACRPALGVGGDYYDFLELPDGKFGIAIGDISGKGIGASLMMASLQASLRGQTIHHGDDLAGLMAQVNGLLYETSTTNRYATFFYAQYDAKGRHLTYVNAGHNPPFLIRKDGEVVKLEAGGPVVGMLPSMLVSYEQGEVTLAAGDVIVGYADGISEAMNPDEEEWGEDEMLAKVKTCLEKSSAEILPLIVAGADEFANGAKQHDDMTMIVIKVV